MPSGSDLRGHGDIEMAGGKGYSLQKAWKGVETELFCYFSRASTVNQEIVSVQSIANQMHPSNHLANIEDEVCLKTVEPDSGKLASPPDLVPVLWVFGAAPEG